MNLNPMTKVSLNMSRLMPKLCTIMKKMILKNLSRIAAAFAVCALALNAAAAPKRVLVVTVTYGFPHSSCSTAERILTELGQSSGLFTVDVIRSGPRPKEKADEAKWEEKATRELGAAMSAEGLKKYDAVIFANTTGDLPLPDKEAFLKWIASGKGFVGMHSATDTYSHHQPLDSYNRMIGGEFKTHGAQAEVDAVNMDSHHPAVAHLPASFHVKDEIYILNGFVRSEVHGLLTLDKHPNTRMPGDYPIAWCKSVGKGRVFYTSLGHREDVWDPNWKDAKGNRDNSPEVALAYQKHILGGIKWALGLASGDAKPQSTAAHLSAEETKAGFRPLFNGVDLTGWKLRRLDGPKSWSAQNGMLVNELPEGGHGTDLVTEEKFWNFTVRYEYMVPKKSNSGFYLRGRHEIQIYDDYDSQKAELGGNGAIYNVKPVSQFVSRKPGEWQQAEATIIGNKVTLTLNGVKVHDNAEVNKATGSELDANLNDPGSIFLQGDHGAVAFRNVRIKVLK